MKPVAKIAIIGIIVVIGYKYADAYLKRWRRFSDVQNSGGKLGVITPYPHALKIGDTVELDQDPPIFGAGCVKAKLADPNYNGVVQVTATPSPNLFVVNKKYTDKNPYQIGSFRKVKATRLT